jgi:shikimate kinase
MGVGKSTIGKALADHRSMYFIDLDDYIEKRVAMPISRIFAEYGEAYFREEEFQALNDLFQLDTNIIALGGGSLTHHDLASKIVENGLLIYLEASPSFLYSRLKNERETRPLIADLKKDEILNFIECQLEKRSNTYQKAQLKLNVEQKSLEEILATLNNSLDLF